MNFTLAEKFEKDTRLIRDGFRVTLDEIMEIDEDVCYLDADLMSCLGMQVLAKKYPTRVINCGIAEANMVGVAAGLSLVGKKPFLHSFGPFASRRVADQVFMSLAYAKLGARIIGSDPGVTAAFNGGTHMPFEDMAIMMSIPNLIAVEAADYASIVEITKKTKDITDRPVYIRLQRKNPVKIYETLDLEIGKGIVVQDGTDITIIASGIMVAEALKARDILSMQNISARVVDMFTWKPIDKDLIEQCAKDTGAIVVAENHNLLCGLGSAVCNVVAQSNTLVPVEKVGVNDEFGQVGPEDFLRKEYKLTAEEIVNKALQAITRKK